MEICPHCVAAAAAGTVGFIPFLKYVVLPKLRFWKRTKP